MIKRFDGANWVDVSSVRRFNGSNWVDCSEVKRFDGSNWVDVYTDQVKNPILFPVPDEWNDTGGWSMIPAIQGLTLDGSANHYYKEIMRSGISSIRNIPPVYTQAIFRTNKPINFKGYTKIKIEGHSEDWKGGFHLAFLVSRHSFNTVYPNMETHPRVGVLVGEFHQRYEWLAPSLVDQSNGTIGSIIRETISIGEGGYVYVGIHEWDGGSTDYKKMYFSIDKIELCP